jgi:predicted DNA-binding transcriptional regulator AlpA
MNNLLTTKQVSKLLSISEKTLANARWSGVGVSIPYVKLSNSVRYKQSDVEAYIEANIHKHTGETRC